MTPELLKDAWDPSDEMCPNCVTPWKCNGPHEYAHVVEMVEAENRAYGWSFSADDQSCIRDLPELMPPNCT